MDQLLQRLRHDVVELSSQGESFTHQIWLMYGQFEQIVDRFKERCAPPELAARQSRDRLGRPLDDMTLRVNETSKRPPAPAAAVADEDEDCESLLDPEPEPRVAAYGHQRPRTGPGVNALLETISVIEDLCDDSDESCSSPEKDSIGYAGSNSVDSGYKSSACPTPDLVDGYYTHHGRLAGRRSHPPLPTKTAAAVTSVAPLPAHSGQDPAQPADLDHLTSLRQTLLKVIHRYDADDAGRRNKSPSPSPMRPRSSSASSGRQAAPGTRPRSPMPLPASAQANPEKGIRRSLSPRSCRVSSVLNAAAQRLDTDSGRQVPQRPDVALMERHIDTLLHGTTDKAEGPEVGESDAAAAQRFSRVARCMLEIIEDLQRQQQLQQQQQQQQPVKASETEEKSAHPPCGFPNIPPRPARVVQPTKSVASVGRNNRIPAPCTMSRRPIPLPVEDDPPSGPDYHLYEEIIDDCTSQTVAIPCQPEPIPPPLPARPTRWIQPHPDGWQTSTLPRKLPTACNQQIPAKPWRNVIRPLRREKNPTCKWSPNIQLSPELKLGVDRPNGNVYTFSSSGAGKIGTKSADIPPPSHTMASMMMALKLNHEHHGKMVDDEYGFRTLATHLV